MPDPVDWDANLQAIRDWFANPQPDKPMGSLQKFQGVSITLNERYTHFDRLGFLFHSRPRIFVTRNPCRTQIVPNKLTKATISMTDEAVEKLAQSWSTSASREISAGVSATIGASVGSDLAGKVSASATSQVNASKGSTQVQAKSIETSIKRALSVNTTVEMDTAPPDCFRIEAPFGVLMTITIRGRIWISRALDIKLDLTTGRPSNIEWGATTVQASVKVDVSVSAGINEGEVSITKTRCESCPGDPPAGETGGSTTPGGGSGSSEESGNAKPRRRRRPRWIGFYGERPTSDLYAMGRGFSLQLEEIGITNVGALALADLQSEEFKIPQDELYAWQDQAAWLASFGALSGQDAALLVKGLGYDDLDQLEIFPIADPSMIAAARWIAGLDEEYDTSSVLEVLAEGACCIE